MGNISFFYEYKDFSIDKEDSVSNWILLVIKHHKAEMGELNYIFLSDDALLELNKTYLSHDYYTDILTFPAEMEQETIAGDIYISIDRVKDNAQSLGETFIDELHRVMIHGVLHLIGFDDHGENERLMREKEAEALDLRKF